MGEIGENKVTEENKMTREVGYHILVCSAESLAELLKMVINQLMENSRLMDNRLAEEDFPVPSLSLPNKTQRPDNKEDVPLLDIPFMLSSFLLSQVLVHSVISVMEAASSTSSWHVASLASHLASLLLWTLQFVWCAWMLNCPVLNLGEGGKIVIKRKIPGGAVVQSNNAALSPGY